MASSMALPYTREHLDFKKSMASSMALPYTREHLELLFAYVTIGNLGCGLKLFTHPKLDYPS